MEIIEILLLGISLSMDAFAVSVCKGLSMKEINWKKAIIIGLYFGIFQALMPLIGYFLGINFEKAITNVDHWIAFILLALIMFILFAHLPQIYTYYIYIQLFFQAPLGVNIKALFHIYKVL